MEGSLDHKEMPDAPLLRLLNTINYSNHHTVEDIDTCILSYTTTLKCVIANFVLFLHLR